MSDWHWHEQYEPNPVDDKEVGLVAVLRKIRYDLTAAQGKLTEAMRMVATLDLGDAGERVKCDRCGASFPGPNTLSEHMHVSHGGPLPETWAKTDAQAAEPLTRDEWLAEMEKDADKRRNDLEKLTVPASLRKESA